MRLMTPALLAALVALNVNALHGAPNDCWPPLNGTSQIVEKPVRVGDYVFGTGSYSFFVGRYSVPSLHCEKSINSGPREWYFMVESGRVIVKGEPEGTRRGPLPLPSPTLPPLSALPPVQASPVRAMPTLQLMDALPPLAAPRGQLPDMPPINNLPDLTDLKPLN